MGLIQRKFTLRSLLLLQATVACAVVLGMGSWYYFSPYRLAETVSGAGGVVLPQGGFSYGAKGSLTVYDMLPHPPYRLRSEEVRGIYADEKRWDKSVVLPRLSRFSNLELLDLSHTDIDDEDTKTLSQLDSVKFLVLSETSITDTGLARLEANQSLEILLIRKTNVTRAGVNRYRKARPDVELALSFR